MISITAFFLVATASFTFASATQFCTTLRVTEDVTIERRSNMNWLRYLLVGLHPLYPMKRSLVRFRNVPSYCDKVISARLFLYFVYAHKPSWLTEQQAPAFPRRIVAHRVLKFWKESQASSTKRYSGAKWGKSLLGLGSDALSSPTSSGVIVNPSVPGFYSLDVTSAVQAWKYGKPNYGLLIRATNEKRSGRGFRFASNADRNSERHAFIQVKCTLRCG